MSIICGSDLSDASSGTLDVACALAAARGDREVILVHVVDPDHAGDAEMQAARGRLDAQVKTRTGVAVRTELVVGPAEETLMGMAETEHCDLIVIAARSTSTTTKKVGTTTANLIARTQVPVLVIRDPAPWLAFAKSERPLRVMLGVDDTATSELGIQWVQALRTPVVMDTSRAREELDWRPAYDAMETLRETVEGARS